MTRIAILSFTALAALTTATLATSARADDVTAVIAGGTLKIKGDTDANNIALDQAALGANQIRVTGTINGTVGPVVLSNFTGGIAVDLGAGDDILTLDSITSHGAVKLALGPGDDTVTLNAATVDEAIAVDLGGGNNALQVCGVTVDKGITMKVGAGTGIGRSATCGSTTANGNGSVLVIDGITVGTNLVLKGSKTAETVVLNEPTINGKSSLSLGGGSDALSICEATMVKSLSVKLGGGASFTAQAQCGTALASSNGGNALVIAASDIDDSFTLKGSAGPDSTVLKDTNVGLSSKVDLGQGTNGILIDGGLTGESLTIKSGKGIDAVTVSNAGIGANLTVSAGAGNNVVVVSGTTNIGKNLAVKTGNDNDTINTTGAVVQGTTKIQHGKGNDSITP
jgi:hypothetical protein